MNFSLKTFLAVATWVALLMAALLIDSPLSSEAFVVVQMLALVVGIAAVATCERQRAATWRCYVAGFLTCYAVFAVERQFYTQQGQTETLLGRRVAAVASFTASFGEYPHPFAKGHREERLRVVLRHAVCGAFGLAAVAIVALRQREWVQETHGRRDE